MTGISRDKVGRQHSCSSCRGSFSRHASSREPASEGVFAGMAFFKLHKIRSPRFGVLVGVSSRLGALLALALLGSFSASSAWAQGSPRPMPPQPLTVAQAVEYGLENNRLLKAADQDVAAAGQRVRQTRADFLPRLDGGYRFQHLKDAPFASLGREGSATQPGGSATFQTGYLNQNRWEVELTQPLFTGFGLTAQHNISRLDRRIAEHRQDGTRLDVQRDIQKAFFQVLLGEKLVQVARDNVKSLEVQKSNAEASFEQGLTARNDVLKADVAVAQALQQERAAIKEVTILRSRLNQLLDLAASTRLELAEEEIIIHRTPDLDHHYVLAATIPSRTWSMASSSSWTSGQKSLLSSGFGVCSILSGRQRLFCHQQRVHQRAQRRRGSPRELESL